VALSARTKKGSTIAVLAMLFFVFDLSFVGLTGAPIGAVQASLDIAVGDLRTKTYGLQSSPFNEYQKLMKERYMVSIDDIDGCTPGHWLISYVNAYNAISKPAVKKKYGPDVFDKSFAEVEQAFYKKHMSRDKEMRPIATGQK
jgi:hypothetical protein